MSRTDEPSTEPLPYSEDEVRGLLGDRWRPLLLEAYGWMTLARTLDARMQALQRQGRVGFYGAATGQEAVNVAAGLATAPDDWIVPGLREQLIALVRGHPLPVYVHHLFADKADPARGRNMPCHPTARDVHYLSMSSVIGTQIIHAVGLAEAIRYRKAAGVAVAFFGDGATSANDFHAGLNWAGVQRVPVLFCCTNNQWAISVPVARQTAARTLADKARAYGLRGTRVDGTDFVAAYAALASALARLRRGEPSEMIEFVLYRMTAHSSSDDPSRYQPAEWARKARATDPMARLELWLTDQGLLPPGLKTELVTASDQRVRASIDEAEATAPPAPESLTEGVFAKRQEPETTHDGTVTG